jgi:uncharacterized protein YaaW (UPF0174 family)
LKHSVKAKAQRMETAEKYRQRPKLPIALRMAAIDDEAKRMLRSAAQRWRQLAEIAERVRNFGTEH